MITFRSISYKNFLSTGNVPNVVDLCSYKTTLITGKNGEGKSTLLCALTYGLFGKPFRNINKPQLINSINQKNLLVEVEFEINDKIYLVKRGIKPNIFEIYCDDVLINEESATRDYQKILEQQILKIDYKTFTQVVILGSATFVPFMQLPAAKRREINEDILDIKVFSIMNALLKSKYDVVKTNMLLVDNELSTIQTKIASQQKLITVMESSTKSMIESLQATIKTNTDDIMIRQNLINSINNDITLLSEKQKKYAAASDALNKANAMRTKYLSSLNDCNTQCKFFEANTTCSTCSQIIHDDHKQSIVKTYNDKIEKINDTVKGLNDVIDKFNAQIKIYNDIVGEINTKTMTISSNNSAVLLLNNQNNKISNDINALLNSDDSNIEVEKTTLKNLTHESISLLNAKAALLDEKNIHDMAANLLKDAGVKTAIINEYLPTINKLINKYLTIMEFYVKFEFDDQFQEVIKSRNRDIFSYNSFSEGEKQKINIALLITWRQIAKMKNSINTNLLIMDEIFDSSLDGEGVEYLGKILQELSVYTNIFVISHRENLPIDNFDNVIVAEKHNEFSVLKNKNI